MTIGTLIQFAAAMRDEFLADNPGAVTKACYQRADRRTNRSTPRSTGRRKRGR